MGGPFTAWRVPRPLKTLLRLQVRSPKYQESEGTCMVHQEYIEAGTRGLDPCGPVWTLL